MNLSKKFLAELFGTFSLVFFGCGVAIVTGNLVAIALAFGLVIVAFAYTIGEVSGCHLNPAVSLSKYLNNEMSLKEFFIYVAAQLLGAILGATILFGLLGAAGIDLGGFATNGAAGSDWLGVVASIGVEIILTLVFVYVILVVTNKKEYGKIAGLIIGATLVLIHLVGIGITGASVNPARSFGPALMSLLFGNSIDALLSVYIFFVGPLVGAVLAVVLFKFFNGKKEENQ